MAGILSPWKHNLVRLGRRKVAGCARSSRILQQHLVLSHQGRCAPARCTFAMLAAFSLAAAAQSPVPAPQPDSSGQQTAPQSVPPPAASSATSSPIPSQTPQAPNDSSLPAKTTTPARQPQGSNRHSGCIFDSHHRRRNQRRRPQAGSRRQNLLPARRLPRQHPGLRRLPAICSDTPPKAPTR